MTRLLLSVLAAVTLSGSHDAATPRGETAKFYQNSKRDFMVNGPQVSEIPPRRHVERTLDLNGRYWCAFGRCTGAERRAGNDSVLFEAGDTAIVIYDVPFEPETLTRDAWYGVVASTTMVQ